MSKKVLEIIYRQIRSFHSSTSSQKAVAISLSEVESSKGIDNFAKNLHEKLKREVSAFRLTHEDQKKLEFDFFETVTSCVDDIIVLNKLLSIDKPKNWDEILSILERIDIKVLDDELNFTLLSKACESENPIDILEKLISLGLNPDPQFENKSLLYIACSIYSPEVVKYLVSKGADPSKVQFAGTSPFFAAARRAYDEDNEETNNGLKVLKILREKEAPTIDISKKMLGFLLAGTNYLKDISKDIIGDDIWNEITKPNIEEEFDWASVEYEFTEETSSIIGDEVVCSDTEFRD